MTRNKSNLNVENNGNGGKITKKNPMDISAVLDAKPDLNDPEVELDVSILEKKINTDEDAFKYACAGTGLSPEKLVQLIVDDTLKGDGQRTKLIKDLAHEAKEKEKQQKLDAIAQEKLRKELEIQELELKAKAIYNGIV